MGIAERKEREKEQRRNDIIDAAERVFFSKGVDAATMDHVAEEAELSKGTLYLYFKSKEELYFAINHRGLKILESLFTEAVEKTKSGLEKVRAVGMAYFRFYDEYPHYFNALLYYEAKEVKEMKVDSVLSECADAGFHSMQILIGAIRAGIQDGSIHPSNDPEKTALLLWGMTSGLIQLVALKGQHMSQEHGMDIEGLTPYAFDFIRRALENSRGKG